MVDTNGISHGFLANACNLAILNDGPSIIDFPGALTGSTVVTCYALGQVGGTYTDSQNISHSFLFDGTNYSQLDIANTHVGTNSVAGSTVINGITLDGAAAGNFIDSVSQKREGFLLKGTNYTLFRPIDPLSDPSVVTAISPYDDTVAGTITRDGAIPSLFLYNGTNYVFPDISTNTNGFVLGSASICGFVPWGNGWSYAVGNYMGTNGLSHGFLLNTSTLAFTSLSYTNSLTGTTVIRGTSGDTLYGDFSAPGSPDFCFSYRLSADPLVRWSVFQGPRDGTLVTSSDGHSVAGVYHDWASVAHAFISNDSGFNFLPIAAPGSTDGFTSISGISQSNAAGTYCDNKTGFLYGFLLANDTNYSTFYGPQGQNAYHSGGGLRSVSGISGTTVSGTFTDVKTKHLFGFLYAGSAYSVLKGPLSNGILSLSAPSGSLVAGMYSDTNSINSYGFLYSSGTYATLYGPQGLASYRLGGGLNSVSGVSGGTVFGTYINVDQFPRQQLGYLYSVGNYTSIYGPNGGSVESLVGYSPNFGIVGTYTDTNKLTHGFLLNTNNYTVIDYPGSRPGSTVLTAFATNRIVGYFTDSNSLVHSFFASIRSPQATPVLSTNGVSFSNGSTWFLPNSSPNGFQFVYSVLSGPGHFYDRLLTDLTFTGSGTVTLVTTALGTFDLMPSSSTNTYTIGRTMQTFTPWVGGKVPFTIHPISLTPPRASSGLPVVLSIYDRQPWQGTISNNAFTPSGLGVVSITASQAGDSNNLPVSSVVGTLTVTKGTQVTTPPVLTNRPFSSVPFSIPTVVTSEGLPTTITVVSGPAKIAGSMVTLTGAGTVVFAFNQPGSNLYLPAPRVTSTLLVTALPQTISPLATITTKSAHSAPFTITIPSSTSGLPTSLSVVSGPAKVAGNRVTVTGPGVVVLAANQTGNNIYAPASRVTTSFQVTLN